MAKEVLVKLELDNDDAIEGVDKLNKELQKGEDQLKKMGKGAKKAESGFKKISKGVKGLGVAFKALGIGLVLKAFDMLGEIMQGNQKLVDAMSTAFNFLSIAFNDFVKFVESNVGTVVDFFKDIFENPLEHIESLAKAIQENLMERINSLIEMFGLLGTAIKQVFEGDFAGALETAKEAGKEFVDVVTGVDDSLNKMGTFVEETLVPGIKDYASSTYDAAKAQTELNNQALIAEALNRQILEQKDREAELQRQIRDDETKTFEERIAANEKLGQILDEQEEKMLANADLRIQQARAQLALDEDNIESQVALIEAETERAAIQAQIAGFRSEQLMNEISLNKEKEQAILDAAETEKEAAEKAKEDAIKLEEEKAKARNEIISTGFAAAAELAGENAGLQKGIAVAETIWSTASAVIEAVKNGGGAPWGVAAGIATAAMGAAQLATILSTDVDATGSSGGSVSIPSPSISISNGNLNAQPQNQIAEVVQGLSDTPNKAYVVSTDVSSSQELDRRIENNAVFG